MSKNLERSSNGSPVEQPAKAFHQWGYSAANEVMTWLSENVPGLTFEQGEQFATVRFESPEMQMLVRNCEPTRMQVVKELRRVADYLEFMAGLVTDTDYSPGECELLHRDLKTRDWLPSPPANLVAPPLSKLPT